MRLPNGFGNVSKLSGKRRNPWRARKTVGWKYIDKQTGKEIKDVSSIKDFSSIILRQQFINIGYFQTQAEAITALSNYNGDPFSLIPKEKTFAQLYEEWKIKYFERIGEDAQRTWERAYNNSSLLKTMNIKDIRVEHLEKLLDNKNIGTSTRIQMRLLYIKIFDHAIKYDLVDKNYGKMCDTIEPLTKSSIHKAFNRDEIRLLMDHGNEKNVDLILFMIYTGMRMGEIISLEKENIDLDEMIIKGGSKTEAGKNRIIPIHKNIIPIIDNRMRTQRSKIFGINNRHVFGYHFSNVMSRYNLNHLPHDTRHTFITIAKECGFDEYILKRIVGHKIDDITESIYTHRSIDQLKNEMDKFVI